jgi:predicted small lipoprotein YifL
MPILIKSILALAAIMSLAACANGPDVCPDGTHVGPLGHHCQPNR